MAGDAQGLLRSGFPHIRLRMGSRFHVSIVGNDGAMCVLTAWCFEVGFTSTTDFITRWPLTLTSPFGSVGISPRSSAMVPTTLH